MMFRPFLPLLAAVALVASSHAQTADTVVQLRRDLNVALQQKDVLAEQAAQVAHERDALKAELESARQRLATAGDQAASANDTDRALKEAQMKADMTVRAFTVKDEEAQRAAAAAAVATQKQADAERERDAALAETRRLTAECAAAKRSEAAALAARAQAQADLYAAQIRIENFSRVLAAQGGTAALPPPATAPTPVATAEPSAPAATGKPEPAKTETSAPEAGPRTHKVAEGENLSLLAFKYYGSPNKWDKIFAANRDKLKNPDQVRPGLVLTIP